MASEGESQGFTHEFVVADEKACTAHWATLPNGKAFFCAFCGHDFVPGDEYRMVYTNDMDGCPGNPLTCRRCFTQHRDLIGLRKEWARKWAGFKRNFKYFYVRYMR